MKVSLLKPFINTLHRFLPIILKLSVQGMRGEYPKYLDILKILWCLLQIKNEQSRLCWTFVKYWQWVSKQKEYLSNKIISGNRCSWKSILFQTEVAFQAAFDQIVTPKPDNKSIVRCLVFSHSSFLSIFVLISKLYTKWNHKMIFKHRIFYHYVYSRYKKTDPS